MPGPNYHDVFIETAEIPRTSLFNLPYSLEVKCTRSSGWELWEHEPLTLANVHRPRTSRLLAGEFDPKGLRLDVAGVVIVDSLT